MLRERQRIDLNHLRIIISKDLIEFLARLPSSTICSVWLKDRYLLFKVFFQSDLSRSRIEPSSPSQVFLELPLQYPPPQ